MNTSNVFLVLAFDHPLKAVESVAERMAAGLACHGVNAVACSLPRDAAKLSELRPDQVSGVLSLGPMPLSVQLHGRYVWELFDCPVSVYLLDALIYDLARVPVMGEFLASAMEDRRLGLVSPEDGYRQWLGASLPMRWEHLPFAAFATPTPHAEPVTSQPRLCVIGTIGSELGGSPIGESLRDLLARVLGHSTDGPGRARVESALLAADAHAMPARTVVDALGLAPLRALQTDLLNALVAIDSWTKRERRLQAVRSLAGVPVDFFGSGWRELLGERPEFRHVGTVDHGDLAQLMPHYRAVVNFDPNWHAGVHDRVYTAAAVGVPVITNHNVALDGAGLPSGLVLRYDANRPELGRLVAGSGLLEAEAAVSRPQADLLSRHNWGTRMGEWLSR